MLDGNHAAERAALIKAAVATSGSRRRTSDLAGLPVVVDGIGPAGCALPSSARRRQPAPRHGCAELSGCSERYLGGRRGRVG